MLWNFRFDRNQPEEILRRLTEEGILSQGWGGGKERVLDIRDDKFIRRCKRFYKLASTRIPSNLTWMREFEDGDLLVVPHLPEYGKASVHVVDGDFPDCYVYLAGDPCHINHGIRVRASYGLDGNISIYNHQLAGWHGRLSGLRLPVIQLPDQEAIFRKIVHDIEEKPDQQLGESKLDDFLSATLDNVLTGMKASLAGINAAGGTISFEAICEHLLKSWGYRIAARHQYDREGGDVDLRCTRQRTDHSPFETGEVTLFIQVKKHTGTTREHAVQQLVKMVQKEPTADGCVMSLGDNFSSEAHRLAQQHGFTLMDGSTICRLLLSRLTAE